MRPDEVLRSGFIADEAERRRIILAVVELVDRDPGTWSREGLIARSGWSPSRFDEAFREVMGVPPHQYILAARITQARYLLAETNLSMDAIAYAIGLGSASYFSFIFNKRVGMRPGAYRRMKREQP